MQRRTAAWIAFTAGFTVAVLLAAWSLRPRAQTSAAADAPQPSIAPVPQAK